jgi:hypothetical protein
VRSLVGQFSCSAASLDRHRMARACSFEPPCSLQVSVRHAQDDQVHCYPQKTHLKLLEVFQACNCAQATQDKRRTPYISEQNAGMFEKLALEVASVLWSAPPDANFNV